MFALFMTSEGFQKHFRKLTRKPLNISQLLIIILHEELFFSELKFLHAYNPYHVFDYKVPCITCLISMLKLSLLHVFVFTSFTLE